MIRSFTASIVRLFTDENDVVGTGFLVSTRYIITCAHVVNQALKRDGESVEQPMDEKVYIDFPCSVLQRRYAARVVCWHPPQPLDSLDVMSMRDIAILELDQIAPRDATETQFVLPVTGERAGHHFHTYGFPRGYNQGVSAVGILRASELNDWLQLEAISSVGIPIEPGFSGAPVWDKNDNGVVGMIVEVATREGVRVAFAIPTEKLIEAWPALDEYVNNNFALISEELRRYLESLSLQLTNLPGYYPRDFSFDRIRQRIRMNQQYDPAYEEADGDTKLIQSSEGVQEGSGAGSDQAYKTSAGGAQASEVVSWETIRAEGAKVTKKGAAVTESIVVDWEMLRVVVERVVILGDPGSGKSWLLKYEGKTIAREQLHKLQQGQLSPGEVLFPIFLRLGTFAEEITGGGRNALELIVQSLKRQYAPSERFLSYIRRWLASTQCLLLLDGLDEVAEDRRAKVKDVLRQIGEDSGCRILLTSRFVGYSGVPFVRKSVKWKQELEIVAFAQEQIEGFIHSWFVDREKDALRLLKALHDEASLRSLAGIPLLLSFLCLVTAESETIPTRRAELYERVLHLLLEASWRKDANDIPEALFDTRLEAKLLLLQSLAWHFATLNGRWHDLMVTQELEEVVRKRSQDQDLVNVFPSYEQLIEELTEKDALLIKVGSSQRTRQKSKLPYLFLHRTIHEYLVARYLASLPIGQCLELIRAHFWFDSNWEVIILLLAGCLEDPNPLLNAFLHEPHDVFHTMLVLAGHCLIEAEQLAVKQEIREKIIAGLFDLLLSSSEYNQARAIQVLGMMGESVLDKVIALVQSKQGSTPLYPRSIREAAIKVLGQINHPRVLPELLTIFTAQEGKAKQESDVALWDVTAQALNRMNDLQAIQVLMDALSLEQPVAMNRTTRSMIRQIDYPQAVRILHNKLQAKNDAQRQSASMSAQRQTALIKALTNIGNAEAVAALLDILKKNYKAYEVLLSLRHFLAGYLSITGDSEEKDFWLEILKAEPMMTLVLSQRGDSEVDALLAAIQCIDNGEEDVVRRWDEAWKVAQPDEEILQAFIQSLWDAPEHYQAFFSIHEIVAWLLGQIHDVQEREASVAKLRAASAKDDDAYGQAVLAGSQAYSETACGAGLLTALQLITDSERRQHRYCLGIWMLPTLLDKLRDAKQDEKRARSLAFELIEALKEIGDRRCVKMLTRLLYFEYEQPWNDQFRTRLMRLVGATGDPQGVEYLINMYQKCVQILEKALEGDEATWDTARTLRALILALGDSGNAEVVSLLLVFLKNNRIHVSKYSFIYVLIEDVIDALGALGDKQATDFLLTMLCDEDWFVRQEVAEALGKLDSVSAVEQLLKDLHTSRWRKILAYSVEFLHQREIPAKSPLVAGFLTYREYREMTEDALVCIGEAEKPQVVKAFLKAAKTGNWPTRRIIKRSIGRLSRPRDVSLILETLLDKAEDLDVRKKAVALLVNIGDERVVDSLLVCLQEVRFVPRIKTALEQVATNCDTRIFCRKLLRADAEFALSQDAHVVIYDLLAQHRSQLREAVGKNWLNWRKKLFRPTAYTHSVVKSQYRIWQWSIRMQKKVTSWNTYKTQLYSAHELYKKHMFSTHSQNQLSPEYKASISEIFMALLGMKENTAAWLSYYGGWLTGVLFLLLWRRNSFVRLHAIQSIIVFGLINILEEVCSSFASLSMVKHVLDLTAFICWVVFMSLARAGKDFKLPIIGGWVSRIARGK
jgi:HEAT repeat protein/uncharacterized membrane protein/S1-C subfamily serine protease